MRIVAGSAKGRPLLAPKGRSRIRPTADRVRETLFNVLGQWMDGWEVLDLYAGTGALGLEALSRGASSLLMVDQDKEAISLCMKNARVLGFSDRAEILPRKVERAISDLGKTKRKFDLIFADPPYAAKVVEDLLSKLQQEGLLKGGGTIALEHDQRETSPESSGALIRVDSRRFGDTQVSLYRFSLP